MAEELVTVTIDGMQVARAEGHHDHRGRQAGRHPRAALLLPSVAAVAGGLPDVPGRGGEGAQADAGLRHRGGRGAGGAREQRQRQEGARGRARAPAHQSPARLPDLRPGRRVRAPGLRVPGGPGRHPLRGVRQAVQPGGGLRARHPLRPQPLHPLHPLRALHGGRRRGRRCSTSPSAATAPTSASPSEQRLDHPWSGNVVDLCPVGSLLSKDFLHKARAWDLDKTRQRLPRLHPGLQHQHRHPRRGRGADPAPAQPRGEPPLHLRLRPDELPLDEPGRPGRGAAGAGRRPARGHRLGHRARPAGPAGARRLGHGGDPRVRAGVAPNRSGLVRRMLDRLRGHRRGPGAAGRRGAARRDSRTSRSARERAPNLVGAELLGYAVQWAAGHGRDPDGRPGARARRRPRSGGRGRARGRAGPGDPSGDGDARELGTRS